MHKLILSIVAKLYANRVLAITPTKRFTYGDIFPSAYELAQSLKQLKTDTVALNTYNSPNHLIGKIAIILSQKIGLYLHPALGQDKIMAILEQTHTPWVIEETDRGLQLKRYLQSTSTYIKKIPSKTFSLNLSSGTTGLLPKIILHSQLSWWISTWRIIRYQKRLDNKPVRLLCLPPLATAGSITFLPILLSGGTYVFTGHQDNPSNELQHLQELIYELQPTQVYITPRQLNKALNQGWWSKPGSVKRVSCGTEPLLLPTVKKILDDLGVELSTGYGMVECLPPLSSMVIPPGKDIPEEILSSAGKILPGVGMKLIEGRLAISSSTTMLGYLSNSHIDKGDRYRRFFITQDYGRIKDNYVYIFGRDVDKLGRTTFSRNVEEFILKNISNVIDVAVVKKDEKEIILALETKQDIVLKQKLIEQILRQFPELKDKRIALKITNIPLKFTGKLDRKTILEDSTSDK